GGGSLGFTGGLPQTPPGPPAPRHHPPPPGPKPAGAPTGNTQRRAATLAGQWCADNYLTRLRLERQLPPVGDSEFSCEQVGQTYLGRVSVRPTPNPLFRRIDVHMLDPEGQHLLLYTTVMSRL
uniref:type II secretion system protein GspI n=1 Tax=Sphaerotilus montanus TaxID=522889 RepID=UPI003FA1BC2D